MNRLLSVALLIAGAYLLITKLGPWVQGGSRPAGSLSTAAGSECVDRAHEAADLLMDAARDSARPGSDPTAWSDASWRVDRSIQSASAACICPAPACAKAMQALDEMRAQMNTLGELVAGNSAGMPNLATRQERIVDLLSEARGLAR